LKSEEHNFPEWPSTRLFIEASVYASILTLIETGMKDSPGSASTTDAEVRKFTITLCKEHLDEVAFLYAQVRRLLSAATGPWTDAQRFEQRLDAHFNALIIEGEHSLDIAKISAPTPRIPATCTQLPAFFAAAIGPTLRAAF
jgi:hypothetical protein